MRGIGASTSSQNIDERWGVGTCWSFDFWRQQPSAEVPNTAPSFSLHADQPTEHQQRCCTTLLQYNVTVFLLCSTVSLSISVSTLSKNQYSNHGAH
jgi:hypothetical protein